MGFKRYIGLFALTRIIQRGSLGVEIWKYEGLKLSLRPAKRPRGNERGLLAGYRLLGGGLLARNAESLTTLPEALARYA